MTLTSPAQPDLDLNDPWAVPSSVVARRVWRWALLALVVGASGVLTRLWQLGVNARRAAVVLLVAALLWEVLLRARDRRGPLAIAGLAAVAVAAELVSAPSGGRAPAVLLLASVTVADAALVEWRPAPGWPQREQPVAGLAVPFLAAAQVVWFRSGSMSAFLALLVLSLLLVECYHRWPVAVRPADRLVARFLTALAEVVGVVVVLVLALPMYAVGLLGRVAGLGPASSRARRRPSGWQHAAQSAGADAGVPFSSPPPSLRRRRHLAALGTVVTTAVVVAGAVVLARPAGPSDPNVSPTPPTTPVPIPTTTTPPSALDLLNGVPYSDRPAYQGARWADRLQRDQGQAQLVPDRTTVWRNGRTTRTRWVNVRDARRVVATSPCPGCPRATIWLVGASAVFGIGQRDTGTIASELVRLAAADGVALDVVNLGVPGWTAHQEVADALDLLATTSERPDAVVVLDGFNDVTAATAREVVGRGDDPAPLVFEEGGVQRALSAAPLTPEQVDRVVDRSVRSLEAEHGRLAASLSAAGVPLLRYFQPDAFASPRQLASIRNLYTVLPGLVERSELGDALARTASAVSGGMVDLRDAYDRLGDDVMADVVHTNEAGAAVVAGRIDEQLGPLLLGLSGRP